MCEGFNFTAEDESIRSPALREKSTVVDMHTSRNTKVTTTTHQRQMELAIELDVRVLRHFLGAFRIQTGEAPVLVGNLLHTWSRGQRADSPE